MQPPTQSAYDNFSAQLHTILHETNFTPPGQDTPLSLLILKQLDLAALEAQHRLEAQGAYAILITLLQAAITNPIHRDTLTKLADRYLELLYTNDDKDAESQFKAQSFATFAAYQALNAAQHAGDIHSWQGRFLHAWCNAAQQLICAAQRIIEKHERSYITEKSRMAMFFLVAGLQESQTHNLSLITDDLIADLLKTMTTSDSQKPKP